MRAFFLLLITAMVWLPCVPADAQKTDAHKIAVIDLQECLNESTEGQKAKKVLETKHETLKLRLDSAQKELAGLKNEIETQGMMMSPDILQDKERLFRRKQREVKDMVRDFNDEMTQDENDMKVRIFSELRDVIKDIAVKQGYTLILEKRTVLYFARSLDVTKEVIKAYDAFKSKK